MDSGELAALGPRLEDFAADVFAPLARADQREKGELYLRGLLADGQRKSMQPMAERLGVDHQGLQQFVSSSTWDVTGVRARLARRAVEVISPQAWVLDDTGFPKDGAASPGVARQYSGTLGKVANCQIGVSVQAVTDAASSPLDWRLFLPKRWDDAHAEDEQTAEAVRVRRARAGIPKEARHREKWRLGLDMLDELAGWDLVPPVVVADAGYGNATEFRAGIAERGWSYMVGVDDDLSAHPGDAVPETLSYSGRGPRPKPRYRTPAVSLREHALVAGRERAEHITWRDGSRGPLSSEFLALRVRPAGRRTTEQLAADGSLPETWLLLEWPEGADEPTDYWLSNLPAGTELAELVRLAKIRWRVEHDYRELKTGLGLDHFEGRTLTGWQRHVTLVTAAQLFATSLRTDPKAPCTAVTLYAVLRKLQALLATWSGTCIVCGCHVDLQSQPRAPT
jgi:SRSO17 transposase